MNDFPQIAGKWLVIWTSNPILVEGVEGRWVATRNAFDWFDTRDDAIAAIHVIDPDWTPPDIDEPAFESTP